MLLCSKCKKQANYILNKQREFLCDDCANKLSSKNDLSTLVMEEIPNKRLSFIKEGKILTTFLNFKYLDSSTFDFINLLREIRVKNDMKILFFPSKEESNKFSKKYFGKEGNKNIESRYRIINHENKYYFLLNYDRIKINVFIFLIEYLDNFISMKPDRSLLNKISNLYEKMILSYNRKLGINLVNKEYEYKSELEKFRSEILGLRFNFFASKMMKDRYHDLVLDNLIKQINLFGKESLEIYLEGLPYFDHLFYLIILYTKWGSLNSIDDDYLAITEDMLGDIIKNSDWKDFKNIKGIFENFYKKISKDLKICKDEKQFLDIIEEDILELIGDIPPIFSRMNELLIFKEESNKFLTILQVSGKHFLLNADIICFLKKMEIIENKIENLGLKYFMYNITSYLLSEYIIINQAKSMFERTYRKLKADTDFFAKKLDNINKSLPETIRIDDIILNYSRIAYLCYCMKDNDKFYKIRDIITKIIHEHEVEVFTKIAFYSQKFFLEEDYISLRNIYRIYNSYDPNTTIIGENTSIRILGIFAEAFFSRDSKEKGEFYSEALSLNRENKIMDSSFQKDITQKKHMNNYLNMFYHLENSLEQKDLPSFISEIKKALLYSEHNKENKHHSESPYYFFYKIKIIDLLLKGDISGVKKYLKLIGSFNFKQSKLFKKLVEGTINVMNKGLIDKLLYLSSLEESIDIGLNIIKKFIKYSIDVDFYEEYKKTIDNRKYLKKHLIKEDISFTEKVFLTLHDFAYYCSQHPKALNIDEVMVRDLYLVVVKNLFSNAEGEAFNYDGKLDFKIINPTNKYEHITGEFKWWNKEKDFKEVFHQLVRKHSTGKEKEVYIVILNRNKDIHKLHKKIQELILKESEVIRRLDNPVIPKGSKEIFNEYLVKIKGEKTPLKLGIINLYHKRV